MPKTRQEKEKILEQLHGDMQKRAVILVDYQGLSVKEITEMRDDLYESNFKMMVIKNTLLARAIKDGGYDISDEALKLPLALIVADDEVLISKLVEKFAKEHEKTTIIGGWIEGKYINEEYIKNLSKLPGREKLLEKLIGSLNAPISGIVNVLAGNIKGLVSVINQYAEKVR